MILDCNSKGIKKIFIKVYKKEYDKILKNIWLFKSKI